MKPLPEEIQNSQKELKETEVGRISAMKQLKNEEFITIKDDQMCQVVNIIKSRFPRAAHVYNMAKMVCTFSTIKAYSLNGDISEKSIFVLVDLRQDYNQDINISVPWDFKVSENVKQAFINTAIIDWNAKYMFSAVDRLISPMILEISTIHKGNSTINNPNYYYFMDNEDAAKLNIKFPPEVEVKPLTVDADGGLELLLKGWKYTRPGTAEFLQDVIENGLTSGVFVNGDPVCGVIENRSGLLGMLFTAKDHRNKGYAQICTQYLMKQLGNNGFVVASAVECRNIPSSAFHLKAGMIEAHLCDYIMFDNLGFEAK